MVGSGVDASACFNAYMVVEYVDVVGIISERIFEVIRNHPHA